MEKPTAIFLYQQLAQDLGNAIKQGVYGVQERMPSLRRITSHYGVSLATAIEAYQLLEDQGLIASRPKSGYFVLPRKNVDAQEPNISNPPAHATHVNVGQLALSLVNETRSSKLVKLGAAVPSAETLPLTILSRNMAGIARRHRLEPGSYEAPFGRE